MARCRPAALLPALPRALLRVALAPVTVPVQVVARAVREIVAATAEEPSGTEMLEGYAHGYSEGHRRGFDEGRPDGFEAGFEEGHRRGMHEGYAEARALGRLEKPWWTGAGPGTTRLSRPVHPVDRVSGRATESSGVARRVWQPTGRGQRSGTTSASTVPVSGSRHDAGLS
jgi:hypothetical protein